MPWHCWIRPNSSSTAKSHSSWIRFIKSALNFKKETCSGWVESEHWHVKDVQAYHQISERLFDRRFKTRHNTGNQTSLSVLPASVRKSIPSLKPVSASPLQTKPSQMLLSHHKPWFSGVKGRCLVECIVSLGRWRVSGWGWELNRDQTRSVSVQMSTKSADVTGLDSVHSVLLIHALHLSPTACKSTQTAYLNKSSPKISSRSFCFSS